MLLLCLSSCRDRIAYFPPPWIFDNPNGNEGALTGQWVVYVEKEDEEGVFEFGNAIIDIQHTKSGYWIMAGMDDESSNEATGGMAIESDRTLEEDGWFVVSYGGTKIRYKFKDGDQDTLIVKYINPNGEAELELKRLDHEVEIKLDSEDNP